MSGCACQRLCAFGRVVVKGQQCVPVLDQLGDSLVPFHAVGLFEEIEGGVGLGAGLGLPDVVQMALGFGLDGFGQRIEHVHGLVNPAPLFPGRGKHLPQRRPEPQGPVADGKLGILFQAAPLEIEQQLAPAFGAFPEPICHGRKFLAAIFIGTHDHQNTLFVGNLIPRIKF